MESSDHSLPSLSDLNALEADVRSKISTLRESVESFSGTQEENSGARLQEAAKIAREHAQKKEQLQRDIATCKERIKNLEQKLPSVKREAESIEQGLKDLHEERQRVVLRKQQLQNMRDDMQRQLIAAKNAKEKQGKSANTEKEINKAELKATVQSSGLSIKPLDIDLNRFTFKFIDPKDWDKKFYFDLRLGKDKYYSVVDCQPPVPNLEQVVEELNQERNIYKFIKQIRVLFSEAANK
ncbi:hypothetical protein VTP01DRAFT_2657 [Rhizomucor pusillus]|uniref:uncharacterized protein n=1 Tax=Rhizomucor pusillus TaxID=4840 RepID=UPI0037449315